MRVFQNYTLTIYYMCSIIYLTKFITLIKANASHPQCSRVVLAIVPGHFMQFIHYNKVAMLKKQVHNFIVLS